MTQNNPNTPNTPNNRTFESPFQNINLHEQTVPAPDIAAAMLRETAEVVLESITPENLPLLLVCVDKNNTHISVNGTTANIIVSLCAAIGSASLTFSEAEFQILKKTLQGDPCWEMIKNIRSSARKQRGLSDGE